MGHDNDVIVLGRFLGQPSGKANPKTGRAESLGGITGKQDVSRQDDRHLCSIPFGRTGGTGYQFLTDLPHHIIGTSVDLRDERRNVERARNGRL
jgi:hypothetical protein